MTIIIGGSHDYRLEIEARFTEVPTGWSPYSFYHLLPEDTSTIEGLEMVEKMNGDHVRTQFRLVGIATDTVKELLS